VSTDQTNEIEEIASHWLIRRQSGHWAESDQVRFEQWLDASTLNRVAYLRLELAWEESARLKALAAGIPGDQLPPPGRWNLTPFFDAHRALSQSRATLGTNDLPGTLASDSEPCDPHLESGDAPAPDNVYRAFARRTNRLVLAASVVLAIVAGFAAYKFSGGGGDRYATPVGGLSSVPMRDGSKITLNTNSHVRVALTNTERRVDLNQGEAFFDVAKDSNRPFVVDAGKKRVVAVGTKFSVRRDGDSIEVVVTEGKVRVEDATRPLRHAAVEGFESTIAEGAESAVFLTPGAIAHVDQSGVLVLRKSVSEAETHLSWRAGVLMFRDESLADAVVEFNRYNVRKIVIGDPAVAALRVEGNFRATNADAFVRLLESGFPVRASAEEDRILLRSR